MGQPLDPILLRVTLSADDFKRAAEFAIQANQYAESDLIHEALAHSAILFYARPFSNNEHRFSTLPKAAKTLTGVDIDAVLGEHKPYHDRIIHLRNKVVAHAEAEFFPAQTGGPLTIGSVGTAGFTMVRRRWHVVDERLDFGRLKKIAALMEAATRLRQFELAREIGMMQVRNE